MGAFVVVDDEEFTGIGEKVIQRTGNHHIHIQKQRRALEAMQILAEGGQLGPAALGNARRQVQRRNRQTFHLGTNPFGIVGQADKAKITTEMATHHGIQAVDVLRPVLGAPLHAQNVTLGRCGSSNCHAAVRL